MALKANQTFDFEEHKRKIFFEHLNPKTTRQSLADYLSGFEIELCVVPTDAGKSKGYGFVIFRKESSVNAIMSQRPHKIDGQIVELYRSVPDQGSLKENKGIKELIVSGFKVGSINKSELEKYFCGFGKINNIDMKYTDDSCCIEFEDYDSVDKALLDRPHIVKNIELDLRKASRRGRFPTSTPAETTTAAGNNNSNVVRKKSNLKQVQIDPEVSTLNIQKKVYCVHITNLPSGADAEFLSTKLNWPMGSILINSSADDQTSSIECWLKGFNDKQTADEFVDDWSGQRILGFKIDCDIEEDRLELCNKFRTGECSKTSEVCDWEHITCTANGKCSSDCPYGHREGMKGKLMYNPGLSDTYQLKITGFQKKLTPDILSKTLNEKNCFVKRSQESVGYIGPIRTIKYARRLLEKFHNKFVDGQRLQCQIELCQRFLTGISSSRSGSMSNLAAKETDSSSRISRLQQAKNDSRNNSGRSSPARDDSDSEPRAVDDEDEFSHGRRSFSRSREDIIKQRENDLKPKAKPIHKSRSRNEISESGRKISKLRSKTDGSFAFLIEYDNTDREIYRRELAILQMLKGVKGVIQLIELNNESDDDEKRSDGKNDLSFVTQYAPGDTLKNFVKEILRGGFGVLQAVQLVQNLIKIIKQVHAKGVLHQNLGPDSVLIKWDWKRSSADEAELVLSDFSYAHIKSEKNTRMNQSNSGCWYKAPQANVESYKYTSTIDASCMCAILFWLLTEIDPRHDQDRLPHEQDNVTNKLDNKISHAVRNAKVLDESQLKIYLIDTFNIGFGYPEYQPWTISDLECRLDSIRELLLPKNPKLNTIDAVLKDLGSAYNIPLLVSSTINNMDQDIFERAAKAFQDGKRKFSESNSKYLWSDGGCTWLDSTQTAMNERRHDDILTFKYGDRGLICSIIITCLATLADKGNYITLSISSGVNGRTSRIPIGCYNKSQNFTIDFEKRFPIELNNLLKSIANERKAASE